MTTHAHGSAAWHVQRHTAAHIARRLNASTKRESIGAEMLKLCIVRDDVLEDGRTEYGYHWIVFENYTEIERGTVTHNRADGWRELVRKTIEQESKP